MKPIVLVIKFTTSPENRELLKQHLIRLFNQICKEPSFVNAMLQESIQKADEVLVYEIWNETVEDFMQVQMSKSYYGPFEQVLEQLGIKREPNVYLPFAQWENTAFTGLRNFCVDPGQFLG
jgi:quinol monooxygenase YgiN